MHKNIVRVNEANVFQINSSPHVVIDMEYLSRGSFEDAIESNSVSIHSALRFIIDCLFALEHAHINGVLHRDVKPANIMLCDFGAKLSTLAWLLYLAFNLPDPPGGIQHTYRQSILPTKTPLYRQIYMLLASHYFEHATTFVIGIVRSESFLIQQN